MYTVRVKNTRASQKFCNILVNIAWLEFELSYLEAVAQLFNHYAPGISVTGWVHLVGEEKM